MGGGGKVGNEGREKVVGEEPFRERKWTKTLDFGCVRSRALVCARVCAGGGGVTCVCLPKKKKKKKNH